MFEDCYKKGYLSDEDLEKVEEGKGRKYYIKEFGPVDSVTSILDKGFPKAYSLIQWFIKNTEAEIVKKREISTRKGTACHEAFEELAKCGFNVSLLKPESKVMLEKLFPWVYENKPKYVLSETPICYISNTVRTAGRIDLVCEMNGERWLIDFKTGKDFYPSYFAQVGLYATALDIDKAGILLLTESGYKFKEVNIKKGFKAFQAAYLLANFKGD